MGSTTTFGPFVLDRERRQLTRHGHAVAIGHRGYLLLEALLDAGGEPVSKDALMECVWPASAVEEGNLTVLVSAVRRQLGDEAAGIVTVPRIGYRLVPQPKGPDRPPADRSGPPLLAVRPFVNHGTIAEDAYVADGMVDDIIGALSRFKNFGVLSRGSTFALRQRGADVTSIAAELGIRYALEGSVRRLGDRLRVTARLFEAATGAALWADRYDGVLADVFSFQDRLTRSVGGVIEPTIRKAEIERARRKPAANIDAYDLYLRALPLVYAPGSEQHAEAIRLLSEASELDPTFALPRAYAALIYEIRLSMRVPPLGNHDAETSVELARTALALGGDDPLVRSICGYVLFRVANDVAALEALCAAVRENPNNAAILTHAADGVGMYGCLEESIDYHSRAYALSPGSHEAYQNLFGIGGSHFLLGHYELAIEWSLKSLATFNDLIYTHVCLTCCYAALDRMDKAYASARRVLEINPALSIKLIQDGAAGRDDAFAVGCIRWLRKVGFPEQ